MSHLSFLIPDSSIEVLALQTQEVITRLDDATFCSDGTCCVDIVTSDHAHSDTCSLAFPDGLRDLQWEKKTPNNNQMNTYATVPTELHVSLITYKSEF